MIDYMKTPANEDAEAHMETPKQRGRPPKPEGERLVNLGIAMRPETIAELRRLCDATGLTQTALVESALTREFRRLRRSAETTGTTGKAKRVP